MIKNLKLKIKNSSAGITLVELVVVIFIIGLFSVILISDFPKIERQFALSRVTYKLAQDLRRAQDLGLSGVPTADINGDTIAVKGYGLYVNYGDSNTKYVIYADVPGAPDVNGVRNSDQKYSGDLSYPLCEKVDPAINGTLISDCVVSLVDISKENPSLYIKGVTTTSGDTTVSTTGGVSINFRPPNPNTSISDESNVPLHSSVSIIFGLKTDNAAARMVSANTFGLIEVK